MISSYGDQSTTGIILHIIIVLHQRCLNCSECFQRHPYIFYTCNYNIRVTHRNGAIKHIFLHESDPRRDHQRIVLYSFCRSMRLLFIWLKYYFKSFCRRFEHVGHTYICRLCFLQNASRTALCYATNTIDENIPNI